MIKRLFLALFALPLLLAIFVLHSGHAAAFNANNLMDDGIFEKVNSFSSPAAIDSWLNANFPSSCISTNNGFNTPDPTGWSSSVNTNHGYSFGGNVSAGQAIWDAAHIYNVNPQVILATLQKEQSVVSGSAGCYPNGTSPGQACPHAGGCLDIAMSYACPGGCDDSYKGFSLQLIAGTWLLRFAEMRAYGTLTGYTGHDPGDENICYSGAMTAGMRQRSASSNTCNGAPGNQLRSYDGSYTTQDPATITVANGATASLYYYTPFESGNQSFDNLFQSWFGNLYDTYTWSVVSQYSYTDATKTTAVDSTNLTPGTRIYVGFKAKNTGDTTWSNSGSNPVHAATTVPGDRNSAFCDATWLSCNRPVTMQESSVAPGQTGTFEFWYIAPSNVGGTYNEHFSLVVEGLKWMNDPGLYFHTVVQPPTYSWSIVSQDSYSDPGYSAVVDSTRILPGQTYYLRIKAKNTGNVTWLNSGSNPTHLGTTFSRDRNSSFCTAGWLACNRPANMAEASVAPGGTATFSFPYTASRTGTFYEHFSVVTEGVTWLNDPGLYYYTQVTFDPSGGAALASPATLTTGQYITSGDGRYRLIMQGDGNLVIYSINRPLWASNTAGKPITRAVMQDDGNLVLYDASNKPYWASNTAGKGSSSLIMQSDGNLVIYNSNSKPTWASNTSGKI